MDIVERAYYFAMAGHAAVGQKRKYTGDDYIVHPVEVCDIIEQVKYVNDSMQCAALMHDLCEDTQITIDLITRQFGSPIATLVKGLTDVSKPEDGNRSVRKTIDRAHIAMQSPACKTIKLADLISNSKSICEHDKDFAKVYIKEKELLLEVLKEGDQTLWNQANEIVQKAKKELKID